MAKTTQLVLSLKSKPGVLAGISRALEHPQEPRKWRSSSIFHCESRSTTPITHATDHPLDLCKGLGFGHAQLVRQVHVRPG